jgi:hypothetical protein
MASYIELLFVVISFRGNLIFEHADDSTGVGLLKMLPRRALTSFFFRSLYTVSLRCRSHDACDIILKHK